MVVIHLPSRTDGNLRRLAIEKPHLAGVQGCNPGDKGGKIHAFACVERARCGGDAALGRLHWWIAGGTHCAGARQSDMVGLEMGIPGSIPGLNHDRDDNPSRGHGIIILHDQAVHHCYWVPQSVRGLIILHNQSMHTRVCTILMHGYTNF